MVESGSSAVFFIDGNNFYHNVKVLDVRPSKIDFVKMIKEICEKLGLKRSRIFYYNSIPNIKTIGEDGYYKHLSFLSGLEKMGIVVKSRKLQHMSNYEMTAKKVSKIQDLELCEKCKPLVTQNCIDCIGAFEEREKGIDVMIVVDMIRMCLKDEYETAVLISGDADFIPALNIIKESGKNVIVASVTAGFSRELKQTHEYFYLDEIIFKMLKQ